jgi:Peptidase A4 family
MREGMKRMTEQVTDSRRISGRGYDALEIKERTEQMVASLRLPAEIPYRFDAVRADDRELIRYGLPPRPNPDLLPRHFDKWTRALSQPIRSVRPAFTVTGVVHVPVAQLTEDNVNSATWSGAVVQSPPPSETFKTVSARWIVPNAWPPASAWNGNGWNNGTYHCSTWVGIDGWNGINELLQGGTASEVVVSGGQITSQRTYAWFEWWPAGEIAFTNLTVKPGDLVNCLVCAPNDSTHGFVSILNEGSRQTASTGITAPGNSSLAGTTAEWITEDPSSNNQPYPMPDYGATFFYDALAGSRTQERDISNAVLVNMVSGGATLSAAAAENNRALLTYAGDHGP